MAPPCGTTGAMQAIPLGWSCAVYNLHTGSWLQSISLQGALVRAHPTSQELGFRCTVTSRLLKVLVWTSLTWQEDTQLRRGDAWVSWWPQCSATVSLITGTGATDGQGMRLPWAPGSPAGPANMAVCPGLRHQGPHSTGPRNSEARLRQWVAQSDDREEYRGHCRHPLRAPISGSTMPTHQGTMRFPSSGHCVL